MQKVIRGKAFVFGANIDTDQIYAGRYLELTDPHEVAKHALEGIDPGFVKEFQPGDIIVASTNFGCGSSREHAAVALKAVGIGAILADYLSTGQVTNETTGATAQAQPLSDYVMMILESGGIKPLIKNQYGLKG